MPNLKSTPYPGLIAVMPALNEEGCIGTVISSLRSRGIEQVIVGDNGSSDRTAMVAREAGALVISESRRGYGSACLAALSALPATTRAILFCDADGADDLDRLADLVDPVLNDMVDLMIASRVAHPDSRIYLTRPQRFGNAASARMMRFLYAQQVTDLGPFRCISKAALDRLRMQDTAFGWTAEMQVKAFRHGLRVEEINVRPRPRLAGESKVSGNLLTSLQAGYAIISTILKYHRMPFQTGP